MAESEMTVDEFTAWLVDEAENFLSVWKEEAALDPEEFKPSMTKRDWMSEFRSILSFGT